MKKWLYDQVTIEVLELLDNYFLRWTKLFKLMIWNCVKAEQNRKEKIPLGGLLVLSFFSLPKEIKKTNFWLVELLKVQ